MTRLYEGGISAPFMHRTRVWKHHNPDTLRRTFTNNGYKRITPNKLRFKLAQAIRTSTKRTTLVYYLWFNTQPVTRSRHTRYNTRRINGLVPFLQFAQICARSQATPRNRQTIAPLFFKRDLNDPQPPEGLRISPRNSRSGG